jgi:O-antigen ligase
MKRCILLVLLVAVCAVTAGRGSKDWRTDIFSKLLASPVAWLMGLSLLVTAALPSYAFTDIGWRGIAGHKNEAGQIASFAVLLTLYGVCHDKLGLYVRSAIIAVSFACLVLAHSTTSLLGVVIGVAVTEIITARSTIRKLGSWKVGILGVILVTSGLVFLAFQLGLIPSVGTIYTKLLAALGKSETFTGRTAIWDLVLGETRFHSPWLGGGYGGFWNGRDSISGYVLIGDLYPGQSHNGYVDIYNDLGYIGLGLVAFMMISVIYHSVRLIALGHPEAKFHLALVLYLLFLNLGESTLMRSVTFMNIIFFASLIRVSAIASQVRAENKRTAKINDAGLQEKHPLLAK